MASASTSNFAEPDHEPFNVPIPSSTKYEPACTTPKRRRNKRKPPRSKTLAKLVAWQPKSFLPAESSAQVDDASKSKRPLLPYFKSLGSTTMPNINILKSPKNKKSDSMNTPTTEPDSSLLDTTTTQSSTPASSNDIRMRASKKSGGETPVSTPSPSTKSAKWMRSPREPLKEISVNNDAQIASPSVQERVHTFFKRRNSVRAAASDPLSCKRVAYGEQAIKLKAKALAENTSLSLLPAKAEVVGAGTDFLRCGMNTLRAELLDMNMMMSALQEHRLALSHSDIDVFFSWYTYFLKYFDRYMILEEDVIISAIEARLGRTRECQYAFRRNLPAGEKLNVLAEHVKAVTDLSEAYSEKFLRVFSPLLDENFTRTQIERLRIEAIQHIMSGNGGVAEDADFIVMYTRWKDVGDLNRWKWKYLIRTNRKFVPFKGWEEDVYEDHFKIAAEFADHLHEENCKEEMAVEENEWIETFRRAEIGMAKFSKSSMRDLPSARAIASACFDEEASGLQ